MKSTALEINEQGLPLGIELVRLNESPSTNSAALAGSASVRRLIWTPKQTAGRGRGSNIWQARPGCLTFTYLEPSPGLPPERLPTVSLIAALAMADALRPLVDAQLKWPNDIYANDRKLCGILVENHPDNALVIGIGLNLWNDVSDIDIPAINVLEAGAPAEQINATRLVASWIQHLLELLELAQADKLRLAEAWRPQCWLSGKSVTMDSGMQGTCRGIDASGGLRLDTPQGLQVVHGGVVAAVATVV